MSMDTNGSHVDIWAGIEVVLGKLNKSIDERNRLQKLAKRVQQPVFYTYSDQAIISGTGFGVIRLTGPDQGHIWYVRGISITDVQAGLGVAVPGTQFVFISASDLRSRTALAQCSPLDWRDTAVGTAPKLYSTGQLPLRFNEELSVVFNGGTSGHQVVATTWVEDFEEGAVDQAWSV